ncbi:MAG: hypothetical protein KAU35_04085, partial [candidate division Zixibacteria bacterium]|nr:hypothetical protein [candidate division Zixibacteria bacterium]
MCLAFCGLVFGAQLNAATVSATIYTNAPDYAPGDSVVIAGSGFWGGETVTVQITPTDGIPTSGEAYDPWDIVAESNGDFETYWIVPEDAVDREMLVEATGQSSGLYATTTFTDCNTRLQITSIPASVPTGQSFQVTALLEQRCGGNTFAPLAGRTVLFFLTEQNCGVDVGQNPDETGVTNASGEATVTLTAPAYDFGVRAKFLGEEKPDPCPDPGNNACNPNDPDPKIRCVKLSASNACELVGSEPSCELSITCPADVTIECDESTDPANTGTATYTGSCPPINLTYSDNTTPGSCAHEYTIARTWTATDAQSNSAQCIQTITVEDNTAPQITCPADVSVQCPADVPAVDVMQIQANDNCDPSPVVVHIGDVSDGQTCPETITRTYRATDDCGNWAECTQTITVDDTQDPTFDQTCPTDVTVECDNVPTAPTLTASDNCDPAPVVTYGEQTTAGSCDQEYILTRTWTATDDCGNSTVCTQVITVEDNTAPQVTCPADVSIQCATDVPAADVGQVQADDNCDPSPVVVHIGDVSDGQTCPETITRTYRATDDCGNWAECTQTITVDDTQDPTFDQTCPTDVTVECDNVPTAPTLTASDNCDPAPVVTYGEQTTAGSCDQEYVLTRTWTATDDCGNSSVCTQVITVQDNTAPTFDQTCPTDVTVECDAIPTAP